MSRAGRYHYSYREGMAHILNYYIYAIKLINKICVNEFYTLFLSHNSKGNWNYSRSYNKKLLKKAGF